MIGVTRTAGVLGGMGPRATVDFLSRVIDLTPAAGDADHVPMLIDHNPQVPSRQSASSGGGEDPGRAIATMGKRLQQAGADFLVMPCNLAHAFLGELRSAVDIPLVSIVDASIAEIDAGITSVGVMPVDGRKAADLYRTALENAGKQGLLPGEASLQELRTLINRVKAGDRSSAVGARMAHVAQHLVERGARTIVAACTEIPLVLSADDVGVPLVSSTDALARKTIALCLGREPLPIAPQ